MGEDRSHGDGSPQDARPADHPPSDNGTRPGLLRKGLSSREALLAEAERVAHMGSWAWDLRSGEIDGT